jgi:hypothetical protein
MKGNDILRLIVLIPGIILLLVSGSAAKDLQFPEMTGWKPSGDVHIYTPRNLYEYINGAADLYLACEFEQLDVAEYINEKKASVVVEAYRHRTPRDAFGIYSQERLPESHFIDIGAQGYIDKNILNFVNGHYYVKINSFNTGDDDRAVLQAFAQKVAEHLAL